MRYRIHIEGQTYELEVENHDSRLSLYLDGNPVEFDYELIQEPGLYSLILNGRQYRVWVEDRPNGSYLLRLNQEQIIAEVENERQALRKLLAPARTAGYEKAVVKAPMPGMVLSVEVREGQDVAMGQALAVIEAMKMENEIRAPVAGKIKKVYVQQGQAIEKDFPLFEIDLNE